MSISKHQKIIEDVVERLTKTENYEIILKNFEYKTKRQEGEVDILAYTITKRFRFYEIKSNHRDKTYQKALQQFHNFKKAYPDIEIKGVYVTPTKIKRLR